MISLEDANALLQDHYPVGEELDEFPFAKYLKALWGKSNYSTHGPDVLQAMEGLLSDDPCQIIKGPVTSDQQDKLRQARGDVLLRSFPGWNPRQISAFFRICVLYHDIGKYIIKDRHPSLGWHVIQYLDLGQKEALKALFPHEDFFRLLSIVVRDHDQFGVINTGEASYPILLRATRSMSDVPQDQKKTLAALMFFNLADMAGSFEIDGESIEKVIDDWYWMNSAIDHCYANGLRLEDYIVKESSQGRYTCQRVQRILAESSREWPNRQREVNDAQFVRQELNSIFGGISALQEFSWRFNRICKMDYGLRFFKALIEYCEGPKGPNGGGVLAEVALRRLSREDVLYAFVAILQRITTSYASMMGDRDHVNLIGVEMKELTPDLAPEKTSRIIELIVRSHYPGLAWMMSDVPAWEF